MSNMETDVEWFNFIPEGEKEEIGCPEQTGKMTLLESKGLKLHKQFVRASLEWRKEGSEQRRNEMEMLFPTPKLLRKQSPQLFQEREKADDDSSNETSADKSTSSINTSHHVSADVINEQDTDINTRIIQAPASKTNVQGMSGGSSVNSTVCGVVNVKENLSIHQAQVVKTENVQLSASVESTKEGSVSVINLSVRAKDGCTKLDVLYQEGEIKDLQYTHEDDIEYGFGTRWVFKNVATGLTVGIMRGSAEQFNSLAKMYEDTYGCTLHRVYTKCLVLEFLHETEDGANSMMKDQEIIKMSFAKFLKDTGQESHSGCLEVSCEKFEYENEKCSKIRSQNQEQPLSTSDKPKTSIKQEMNLGFKKRLWKGGSIKREAMSLHSEDEPAPKKRKDSIAKENRCGKCDILLEQYRNFTEESMFIVHLPTTVVYDPDLINIYAQEKSNEFLKLLSALRNADGGTLLVHLDCERRPESIEDGVMAFVDSMCERALAPQEAGCDTFNLRPDSHNVDLFILQTEKSASLITVDCKTKIPGPTKYWGEHATPEKLMGFLSRERVVEYRKPVLRGITVAQTEVNVVKLYLNPDTNKTMHEIIDIILEDILLPEHITSCSKRKHGGSIFIGHPTAVKSERMEQTLDMTGLTFEKGFEEKFCHSFHQALERQLLIYNNPHSEVPLQVENVFEIGLHKLNEGFIVEVAVRAVYGCVFYDPKGPEAYNIENGVIKKIPFDIWIGNIVNC